MESDRVSQSVADKGSERIASTHRFDLHPVILSSITDDDASSSRGEMRNKNNSLLLYSTARLDGIKRT